MSATIVTDFFTEHLKNLSHACINNTLVSAKITLGGVTYDLMTPNRAFIYDDKSQPRLSSWVFFGTFEVAQDNTPINEIEFVISSECGDDYLHLRIISVTPVVLNKGFYGILLAYEYQAPKTVTVVLR